MVKRQWFPEGESKDDDGALTATVSQRSWIFTSATLGSDERLTWFLEGCGLQGVNQRQLGVHRVSSPFNYEVQSALYVPSNFPKPNEPEHTERVSEVALEATQALGGRTLVLTTTLRALRQIGETLTERLSDSGIAVLVQGQQSKRELIERFRAPNSNSVLVASASFWEGVDIAGDALQCVIIDKLPFPPPGDPLVDARSKRLEAQGRSSFNDYSIPEAAISLKQGTGRLIRSEGDVGVLVVCDPRLVQMGYGRRLIGSLPTMPILRTSESWREWLGLLHGITSRV
jgi:ATP-dependent DNA helicase DinG